MNNKMEIHNERSSWAMKSLGLFLRFLGSTVMICGGASVLISENHFFLGFCNLLFGITLFFSAIEKLNKQ